MKASIRKLMGSGAARGRGAAGGKSPARKAANPAKGSRTTRYHRILAEMEAQIAELKASLDGAGHAREATRVPEEVETG